jgi:predicted heme/steroid binding protein/uncharacterized membrane protein
LTKIISEDELHAGDGQEGRPTYVAVDGKVYDVTHSRMWKGGLHVRRHQAGHDLTADMATAPHDASVLTREHVALVGELAAAAPQEPAQKSGLERLLDLYFSIHPHPVAVHFPVAYVAGLAVLLLLYLVTRNIFFEMTAYYLLWMGVIMTPLAMLSGGISWWFNYGRILTDAFKLKIGASAVLFILSVIALVIRETNPSAFMMGEPIGWVYFGVVMLMLAHVAILGWVGARIAFPSR